MKIVKSLKYFAIFIAIVLFILYITPVKSILPTNWGQVKTFPRSMQYSSFGLDPCTSTIKDIKKKIRTIALKDHPDLYRGKDINHFEIKKSILESLQNETNLKGDCEKGVLSLLADRMKQTLKGLKKFPLLG
jgi:hypothetical protein